VNRFASSSLPLNSTVFLSFAVGLIKASLLHFNAK
jgi:hypothetical protein